MLPLTKLSIYSDDWVLKLCTISFWLYARPILNSHLSFMAAQWLVIRSWASNPVVQRKTPSIATAGIRPTDAHISLRCHNVFRPSYYAADSDSAAFIFLFVHSFMLLFFVLYFLSSKVRGQSSWATVSSVSQYYGSIHDSRLTLGKMVANTLISSERGVA